MSTSPSTQTLLSSPLETKPDLPSSTEQPQISLPPTGLLNMPPLPPPPPPPFSQEESENTVCPAVTSNVTIVKPPKPSPSNQSIPPTSPFGATPLTISGSHTSAISTTVQGTTAPEVPLTSYPRGPPPRGLLLRGHPYPGPRGLMPRVPPPRLPINRGPRPDLIMMVPPVPPGIPADLWEWFFHSDKDKDGRITASEVQRLLLKGKWSPFKEETCKMMLDMMDVDKIGTLDAYQMTLLWNSLVEWKNIFDELDTEKRGCLNASQMFKALEKFGYRLSSEFCDAVVDRFGVNYDEKGGEQVLYFDDFIQTRVMLKSLTESFQLFDTNKAGVIDLHYEQFLEMVLTNAM